MKVDELFEAVATVFKLGNDFKSRKLILCRDNEAACAALTIVAATDRCALMLVFTLWPIAAQFDFGLWTERVTSKLSPSDLPSR